MSPFEDAALKAEDRGEYSLARRIRVEDKMATALVEAALDRGLLLSVFDGEEWTVKRSTDKSEIIGSLFSTDADLIRLRDRGGTGHGQFWLVYGSDGYDVVSDYTVTDTTEAIYNEVLAPLSDRLEAGR